MDHACLLLSPDAASAAAITATRSGEPRLVSRPPLEPGSSQSGNTSSKAAAMTAWPALFGCTAPGYCLLQNQVQVQALATFAGTMPHSLVTNSAKLGLSKASYRSATAAPSAP